VKHIDELKIEKNSLTNGVIKMKRVIEDLKKKNNEKSDALKSIKNFFLTSTVFKIKSVADFEEKKTDK
jgi:FtsZ-binding cell division protein ZapB